MFTLFILAAASFLTSPVEEIVLRSGQVIPVEELVRVERGRLLFVNSRGTLYSLSLSDVDVEKTDARLPANRRTSEEEVREKPAEDDTAVRKLPVSDEEKKRILAEMEGRSHTGSPANASAIPPDTTPDMEMPVEGENDEWKWREASRRYRDAVERAKEQLEGARQRERELNDLLLFFAGGTGDATHYSYLVVQLADLRSLIPQLQAEVRRAEDAWFQFREDARRQGVLPGWLR